MRRFRSSKYKNAAPKQHLHPPWIKDLNIGSYQGYGNLIKASAAFVAFNVNPTGSQLGVVGLDSEGSGIGGQNIPILNAHSDLVTDFDFSPFEDGLLATCSADSTVKIWNINLQNLNDLSLLTPECATSSKQRRVETVEFHPIAEGLLTYTSQNVLSLWDILHNKELMNDDQIHQEKILSISWSKGGELVASVSKDKMIRLVDPRTTEVVATAMSHENDKDARVLWLGESKYVLSSGFDSSRVRQIFIRDTRKFDKPVKIQEFGSSTGILIPLYDQDTNMMFIAARGESSISYFEFNPDVGDFLIEGYRYNGDQTKGACLVPKRVLKVMETEVNRVLQLTANSVVGIPYYVPRKSYIDFHHDLFPDTKGTKTSGAAETWMDGHNGTVFYQSLNPSAPRDPPYFLGDGSLRVFKSPFSIRRAEEDASIHRIIESAAGSGDYKKDIPEPRPRKKSLTPCSSLNSSSSSDEVGDVVVAPPYSGAPRIFPVPKPRVGNSASTSSLRTPSSFLPRLAADFSRPTFAVHAESHSSGPPSLDQFIEREPQNKNEEINEDEDVVNNGDYHNGNNNDNGHESSSEYNGSRKSSSGSDYNENGNSSSEGDLGNLRTSDRRKLFEQMASQEFTSNGYEMSSAYRQARVNVAERKKLFAVSQGGKKDREPENMKAKKKVFQQVLDSVPCKEEIKKVEPEKVQPQEKKESRIPTSSSNPNVGSVAKDGEFNRAPITKPERKFTPPKSDSVTKSMENIAVSRPVAIAPKASVTKRIETVFGQVSKYRNFKVKPLHRKYHLENLRNISSTCPGESEAIQANPDRIVVPLSTPGGKLAVFELSKPGRQPDGVIPALVHGTKVMDFTWDPFDNTRLAVGSDDGRLWIWKIPEAGLKEQTNEPQFVIPAHGEKIYIVRFHPLAKDILATASYDQSIRVWNLSTKEGLFQISCHDQVQILSMAWSPCGAYLATMAKDGKLRIYEPRVATNPLVQGKGPNGVRGGRVTWALDGHFLIVSGFEKSSERQIQMYSVKDLSRVTAVPLDVSPSILVPFYDEDSSILFLYGRGDSTILAFDVTDTAPFLKQVNQHRLNGGHQGIAFLKKNAVDVQNVEFAKAYRLTDTAIEPLSFTVPRVKSEYFQDDLFPPTKILWEPSMTAQQWIKGANVEPRRVSLKPESMKAVGDIGAGFFNKEKTSDRPSSKPESESRFRRPDPSGFGDGISRNGEKQQEQLEQAIRDRLEFNTALEQDTMEGVDVEEWGDLWYFTH